MWERLFGDGGNSDAEAAAGSGADSLLFLPMSQDAASLACDVPCEPQPQPQDMPSLQIVVAEGQNTGPYFSTVESLMEQGISGGMLLLKQFGMTRKDVPFFLHEEQIQLLDVDVTSLNPSLSKSLPL